MATQSSRLPPSTPTFGQSLLAGAMAGTAVDVSLFPLDTVKTRLQSASGFSASGGFRGIYKGLSSALIGSAPGAAMFFMGYDSIKKALLKLSPDRSVSFDHGGFEHAWIYMLAAAGGEISACTVRVPTEVIKQRLQTNQYPNLMSALSNIYSTQGLLGFYRGYSITIFREIPFSFIQFPLYESLKHQFYLRKGRIAEPWEAAVFCGSISGAVAAAATTPLDVIKTRIMLAGKNTQPASPYQTFKSIVRDEGAATLFSGIGPRVLWISVGGCIFLGVYEMSRKWLMTRQHYRRENI